MEKKQKTAVLLYGFLRTAEMTVGSLVNNIIIPNDADLFYFGPDSSDNPSSKHQGILDADGFIKINPKNDEIEKVGGIGGKLFDIYGDYLKAHELHDKKPEYFKSLVSDVDPNDWLYQLDPMRFISMFFNMQGAVAVMKRYEEEHGFKYDKVILTRPDLSFYTPIKASMFIDEYVHIPAGTGFCPHTGNKNRGLAPVLFYLNRETGRHIPTGVGFNDQLFGFSRNNIECLLDLHLSSLTYMNDKVPLTPETLLYYHLVVINNIKVRYVAAWSYEIVRSDAKKIINVLDLMTLDIIDRYHPNVIKRVKSRPLKYFIKFSLIRWRKIRDRFLR